MNSPKVATTQTWSLEALTELIVDCIQDIKGKNIVRLDLRALDDAPTEFFVVCEGDSHTQVKAIADNIHKRLKLEADNYPNHIEGTQNAQWVLLDYFNILVHVFHREVRSYYELEDLWSDATFTEYDSL